MAVYLAVADDVFVGDLFCTVLNSHEMSWMRSETELIQFLRIFLTTFSWLVGCFGFNGPLRQYFSLYRAVSQREGERGEKR